MSDALTLQDLVSHVMDVADLSDNQVDVRRATRAAIWGYEQATTRHQWSNYDDQFTAYFNAKYETGTIDIDSAGVVTLTGGTFPSWAALASVYIDDDRAYRVKSRGSDTEVTLENWTGETATGSAYVLRQDRVLMDDDVREVYDVWNETENWSLRVVDVKTFRDYDRPKIYSGSDPYVVTFRTVNISGVAKTEMRISPGASNAVEMDVAFMRRPRRPRVLHKSVATVATNAVTLVNPLPLGVSAVGCLVRHGGILPPTADQEFGIQTPSLATSEGVVTAQASTTSLTTSGVPDITSESIVITDVLDIPRHILHPVQLYAEAQMRRIGHNDIRSYQALMAEADEQLRYAMEQDAPYDRRSSRPLLRVDHLDTMQGLYIEES